MDAAEELSRILVCPECRRGMAVSGDALSCAACETAYQRNPHGYFDFTGAAFDGFETTSEEYAEDQKVNKRRFYDAFLKPWLDGFSAQRVLEVGTGMGMEIRFMLEEGRQAYGVDLACLSRFWEQEGNDPAHFLIGDGARLPFPDGFFDAVYTLGVIEHVGTQVGHYTLSDDYQDARRAFAAELLRVTRDDGRVLVTCPNKRFPIDLAHEPTDAATPPGKLRVRRFIYDKTGMTLHPVWGDYHLLSHGEIRRLFCTDGGARACTPLSAKGYFVFERFGSGPFGALRSVVSACVNNLPRVLRATPINPFAIVEIRK